MMQEAPFVQARRIMAVVIAASTGGPKALIKLCSELPGDFPVPIALVQHNSSGFDKGFVQWLDGYTELKVQLAENGGEALPGRLYVAPTEKHLIWGPERFALSDEAPVNNQKPAADVLFKSAASAFRRCLASVVLTGMGVDGAEGTRAVHEAGGLTIAQDEASSMIYGMPRAAFETGCVDMVLPLSEIARRLVELCRGAE
jgi:two-component system chemotaxis response regulator CheB